MHILTLTPFFPTASNDAAGCFIAEPIAAMQQGGVKHSVFAVQPFYRSRRRAGQLGENWISYVSLPGNIGLPSAGLSLYARLRTKVEELNRSTPVTLLHAHGALPCGHAAMWLAAQLRVPFVVTVHGLDAYFTRQAGGFVRRQCKRICNDVYRSARSVICISEKVRQQVSEGASGQVDTTVIYNSADPELFSPGTTADHRRTILSVGNLIPIKGHELLIRAIAELPRCFVDVHCEIIGDGPEKAGLERLAQELKISGRVHLLGARNRREVAAAMRRCAVFALPSRYEGLGCVYLEAMASEKPAIALRGQAIEEIIQHRTTGWLSDDSDVHSLTESLTQLLGDEQLRKGIGYGARVSILQRFTVQHQAAALAGLYAECAA